MFLCLQRYTSLLAQLTSSQCTFVLRHILVFSVILCLHVLWPHLVFAVRYMPHILHFVDVTVTKGCVEHVTAALAVTFRSRALVKVRDLYVYLLVNGLFIPAMMSTFYSLNSKRTCLMSYHLLKCVQFWNLSCKYFNTVD